MTTPYSEPWEGSTRALDEPPDPAARAAAQAATLFDRELAAMRDVFNALYPLKPATRERVLRGVMDRLSPPESRTTEEPGV